jgi:mono/diheme cytochrome c family protein
MLIPTFRLSAAVLFLLGTTFAGVTQTQSTPTPQHKPAKQQSRSSHGRNQVHEQGERIFIQNCARCHTAPDSFSPGISGTIVRHMRVRAALSAHDEQELLRYLNP